MTPDAPPTPEPTGYCLRCGAWLDLDNPGEPGESRCARCGLPFDPGRRETYRSRPPQTWVWRSALVAVVILVLGVLSYAQIRGGGQMGSALFLALPFAIGTALGFTVRATVWLSLIFGLLATASLVFAILTLNLAGIFCGMTLGLVFLAPMLVGCTIGWVIQRAVGEAARDGRRYVFLTVVLVMPFGADGVERRWPMGEVIAEVSTSATIDAPADRAWESVLFYEEVEHPPPFLLRLALPKPIRAEGRRAAVGDEQRCLYDRGHITKRITALEPPRFLAFDVVEQHVHFEHDVELRDGSFIVQPIGAAQARVVLTTRYRRLLRPAWLWEPIERTVVHTLHEHVLEGMRRRAEAIGEDRPPAGE